MSIAVVASGQVGADTAGNLSSSFVAGTCNAGVVLIVSNASNAAPVTGNVTWGGVNMTFLGSAVDTTTELGRVDAYFLGDGALPSGTQTIAFTQSGGATKKIFAVSFSCASGKQISLYKNAMQPGVDSIPATPALGTVSPSAYNKFNGFAYFSLDSTASAISLTEAIPATRTVYGVGAMFSGGAAASLSVSTGTELAESNFSGNSQSASLLRCAAAVNNGNLTMAWSQTADDAAAAWVLIEECDVISGTYTHGGSAVTDGFVSVLMMTGVGSGVTHRATVATNGSGAWASNVPVGMKWVATAYRTNGGSMYVAPPNAGLL